MKSCPNQKANLQTCNCTYATCLRKGMCCACVSYHRDQGELPACYFSAQAERAYDRSIDAFMRTRRIS
ncbi:MAG TPA: DUF6485 family protein [Candidatus Omnitrophota bacterium]|nr:DUF6485 family protein [Candidatus Omnitrophota bacterium]HPT07719.1 DUF6485 family protein [Candidatus Omnitrophota bacterium]